MTKALLDRLLVSLGLALVAVAAPGPSAAAEGTPGNPLRPLSECLDPAQARRWAIVDPDKIVVDAGRRRFLIQLDAKCPDLHWTQLLQFRTAGGSSRLCGHAFEAVLPDARGGVSIPCTVRSITSIDRERYRALTSPKDEKAVKAEAAAPDTDD